MPFKKKDVKRLARNISEDKEDEWKTIANKELKKCVASGGEELVCEINAVKIATATVNGSSLTEARYSEILEESESFRKATKENKGHVGYAEASDSEDFQLALPIGTWQLSWYGEVVITRTYIERIVENFKKKVLNEREPYIDTDHDGRAANGWIVDMRAGEDGLEIKIDWNEVGKELVSKKIYRYFSAEIGEKIDIVTGERVWPVVPAVTLTNRPAMNTLPEAKLDDPDLIDGFKKIGDVTEDGGLDETLGNKEFDNNNENGDNESNFTYDDEDNDNLEGANTMKFAEILALILKLSDDEKNILRKELGLNPEKEKQLTEQVETLTADRDKYLTENETLKKANTDLTEKVNQFSEKELNKRKTDCILKALSEGRIFPKDKQFYEEQFDKNPDSVEAIINKLPKAVSLKEDGPEGVDDNDPEKPSTEKKYSGDDKVVAENLREQGFSEKEIEECLKAPVVIEKGE